MKKSLWLLFPILLITFSQVLAQNTRSAKNYLRHGLARFAKGDLDGAIGDYNRALEADPKFAEAYLNRGKARQVKKDLDGAIADYEAALINDSALMNESREIAQAHLRRGEFRLSRFDLDGAIADFNRSIQINPQIGRASCRERV